MGRAAKIKHVRVELKLDVVFIVAEYTPTRHAQTVLVALGGRMPNHIMPHCLFSPSATDASHAINEAVNSCILLLTSTLYALSSFLAFVISSIVHL